MKKYTAPDARLLLVSCEAVMVSDENETPKDHIDGGELIISDIRSI